MTPIQFTKQPNGHYSYEFESTGYKRVFQLTTVDGPIAGVSVNVRLGSNLPWVRLSKVRPADNSRDIAFAVAVDEGISVQLTSVTPVINAAYTE